MTEYQNGVGYPADTEKNFEAILCGFQDFCVDHPSDKHYLVSRIGKNLSVALLWNTDNKHSLYAMIYDKEKDTRLYTVNLKDVPDLGNNNVSQKIIKNLPKMCQFTEHCLESQKEQDMWMLNDLQKYANAIDELDFDY